jgi:hypothetical protein
MATAKAALAGLTPVLVLHSEERVTVGQLVPATLLPPVLVERPPVDVLLRPPLFVEEWSPSLLLDPELRS